MSITICFKLMRYFLEYKKKIAKLNLEILSNVEKKCIIKKTMPKGELHNFLKSKNITIISYESSKKVKVKKNV